MRTAMRILLQQKHFGTAVTRHEAHALQTGEVVALPGEDTAHKA